VIPWRKHLKYRAGKSLRNIKFANIIGATDAAVPERILDSQGFAEYVLGRWL